MIVQLTLGERLVLTTLLPQSGNAVNYRLLTEARLAISFDEVETAILEEASVEEEGSINLDILPQDVKEYDLSGVVIGIATSLLVQLDKDEAIDGQYITLYDKFVSSSSEVEKE